MIVYESENSILESWSNQLERYRLNRIYFGVKWADAQLTRNQT